MTVPQKAFSRGELAILTVSYDLCQAAGATPGHVRRLVMGSRCGALPGTVLDGVAGNP